jgi:Transposase DDE domain
MFVRTKSTPNSPRKSVQICENYRVGAKVKQRIIQHVGMAMDKEEEEKLKNLALTMIAKLKAGSSCDAAAVITDGKKGRPKLKKLADIIPPDKVTLADIYEEKRIIEGVNEVGNVIFNDIYSSLSFTKGEIKILRDIVLQRIANPVSKYKTQSILSLQYSDEHNYSLDAIYRVMDKIYGSIDKIKNLTFKYTAGLFPNGINLLLFDVTTLYFESIETDELRNFGYSKDHRFNTTQLVLALATNDAGLPVGYELFSGNTAEVKTLLAAIDSWKNKAKLPIKSVCFVGDRAMFSKDNLALLEKHGHDYIIAAKLRKLPQALIRDIGCEDNYKIKWLGDTISWIGEFTHEGKRLIVNYRSSRAINDLYNRNQILEKLNKSVGKNGNNPSRLISNSAIKKFTTKDKNAKVFIDQDKIDEDAYFDGMHGLITSLKTEKAEAIISRYAKLWIIEESFRINKHTLRMRPVFHFKPERIHAHIAICYMAFTVTRHLQYRISLTQKIPINQIIEELINVQSTIYTHKVTGDRYIVPGSFSNDASKIYKAVGVERNLSARIYQPTVK